MKNAIAHILQRIRSSEIVRNVAKLFTANVLAQLIGLVVYPVLTRLYTPEQFGAYNVFLTVGGLLTLIATGEYQYAIVLPKKRREAAAVFHAGMVVALAVTLLLVLSLPFGAVVATWLHQPELQPFYGWLPGFVLGGALWNLLSYWYIRQKRFDRVSAYQVGQNLWSAALKCLAGFKGFLNAGLVVASVAGMWLSIAMDFVVGRRCRIGLAAPHWNDIKAAFVRYRKFPLFALPRAFVNNFGVGLPVLLLSPFFGLAEVGYFGLALTLAFRPMNMIASSLYQVLFQRTAGQVGRRVSIAAFHRKFIRNAFLILVPVFVVLAVFIPEIVKWLLGDRWTATGRIIRLLLPWIGVNFVVASIDYFPEIFGLQRVGMWFEGLYLVARAAGLLIGIIARDFLLAIGGMVALSVMMKLVYLWWMWSVIRKYEKTL